MGLELILKKKDILEYKDREILAETLEKIKNKQLTAVHSGYVIEAYEHSKVPYTKETEEENPEKKLQNLFENYGLKDDVVEIFSTQRTSVKIFSLSNHLGIIMVKSPLSTYTFRGYGPSEMLNNVFRDMKKIYEKFGYSMKENEC